MAGDQDPEGAPKASSQSGTATERLSKLSDQLSAPAAMNSGKSRKSRKTGDTSALPADYSDILGHISTLQKMAATPDPTNRGYVRQKTGGKLWVRERVEQLLDQGSFREIGSVSGTVNWRKLADNREEPESFVPSNNVQGFGKLAGRQVVFTADDFSIRAGHADGSLMAKTIYIEKLAIALKLPIVKLVDGSSGGGSVTTIKQMGWSYIPGVQFMSIVVDQLNQGIPNLGAVLGPAVRRILYQIPLLTAEANIPADWSRRGQSRLMSFLRNGRRYRFSV
jgi:Carboxyl transferase domain